MAIVFISTRGGKISALYLSLTDEHEACEAISRLGHECQKRLGHTGDHVHVWADDGPAEKPVRWS